MSIKTVYECDICEMERREANHWFVAIPVDETGVAIFPWKSGDIKDKKATHLCGESCVIAFMSRFLLDSMPKPPDPPQDPLPDLPVLEDEIPW